MTGVISSRQSLDIFPLRILLFLPAGDILGIIQRDLKFWVQFWVKSLFDKRQLCFNSYDFNKYQLKSTSKSDIY
jgi:hypothetical protein